MSIFLQGSEKDCRDLDRHAFRDDPLQRQRDIQDKNYRRHNANFGGSSSSVIIHEGNKVLMNLLMHCNTWWSVTCERYRFVEPFAEEVDYWERILSTIGEVLETTVLIQRGYMHMDNIFTSEDIRKQLPKEADEYDKLTFSWIEITSRMASHGLALQATHDPRMYCQKMSA